MFINKKTLYYKSLLLLICSITFMYGCSSTSTSTKIKQDSKINISSIKINNKIGILYKNQIAYIVPFDTNVLNFNIDTENTKNIKFFQNNILIKDLDIKENSIAQNIAVDPKFNSLRIVFSNDSDKLERNINLYHSNINLSNTEEILDIDSTGSYANFLVGTQSTESFSKYNYNYIYRENVDNHIGKKIMFSEKTIGNIGKIKSLGDYILASIPVNKIYDTFLIKPFLYHIDKSENFSLVNIDLLYNNNVRIIFKENKIQLASENKIIDIPLANLNKDFINNFTDESKDSFKIRGLIDIDIFQSDNTIYLKGYYYLYNEVTMPILNLATLTIDYKVENNKLVFNKIESKLID